jgi:hypothetical protein
MKRRRVLALDGLQPVVGRCNDCAILAVLCLLIYFFKLYAHKGELKESVPAVTTFLHEDVWFI